MGEQGRPPGLEGMQGASLGQASGGDRQPPGASGPNEFDVQRGSQ